VGALANVTRRPAVRAAIGALLAPIVALLVAAALTPLPRELVFHDAYSASVRFVDRDGAPLREVRADDATRARWVPLEELGDNARKAILAAEDRRFDAHPGIDPVAMVRAAGANVLARRIVSGASTITMQLARRVRPHRRNLLGKLGEMALALRIEATLSKHDVLEEYMNRAPFGPALRGLDAASRFYFDKPPAELSLAEAAALAGIPRGPDVYSPQKHPDRVLRRRDRILGRMRDAGWISREEHDRAVAEPLALHLSRGTFGAPHLVQALYDGTLDPRVAAMRGEADLVTTTLARGLQREAETAAFVTLKPLARRHVTAASAVVLDNESGEILAYVGSPNFQDAAHGGQNDGARARRQPGSTLKPFVYGLAMEKIGLTAATALPDVELKLPIADGIYAPLNYDERFHGPVRVREALANSFNVPAVWTVDQVGVAAFLDRLHALGFASLTEAPEWYGPGIALGDGEVTLLELANAYATIARGGVWRPVRAIRSLTVKAGGHVEATIEPERRVMPHDIAAILTDVLKDRNARLASFGERSALDLPFDVAAKTGTSKGYRDNWTIGFTREVTVAVWVGNFDGSPMEGVSGITGAAPLFRAVMEAAMRGRTPAPMDAGASDPTLVRVAVCPLSGGAPGRACPHTVEEWVPAGGAPLETCRMHERVAIDRRTNLRAGSRCAAAVVEERTFERFDGTYGAWARAAHRDLAPDAFSASCPSDGAAGAVGGGALRIGYPHDGARFLLDQARPRAQQALSLRVEAPSHVASVTVRIDGRIVETVGAPFVARWPLSPGEHVVMAEAPGLAPSAPVRVRVD
jgi:penicillin-binding protein 1C